LKKFDQRYWVNVLVVCEISKSNATMLIIVTGLPCSGKTRLGREISRLHKLPFISKDGFKERLFDTLGYSDRAWSRKLGAASYEMMFYVLEELLEVGQSCVLEANFYPNFHSEPLARVTQKFQTQVMQIHCVTRPEVLLERFKSRWNSGERHPGHADEVMLPEMELLVKQKILPLELPGPVFELDTTDLANLETAALFAAIEAELKHE
jgi:predicted kinase